MNLSTRRPCFLSIYPSELKLRITPPKRVVSSSQGNSIIGVIPLLPCRRLLYRSSTSCPRQEITPIPVTTILGLFTIAPNPCYDNSWFIHDRSQPLLRQFLVYSRSLPTLKSRSTIFPLFHTCSRRYLSRISGRNK